MASGEPYHEFDGVGDALAAHLGTTFTPGVYAVVGSVPRADAFPAGREGDDFCDALGHMVDTERLFSFRALWFARRAARALTRSS